MKKQEIISVLYELHKVTGFRMSLHDVDCNEVAAYPPYMHVACKHVHGIEGEREKCCLGDAEAFRKVRESGKPVVYKCRFGMTEAISPLYNFGVLTGYLMMGQVLDSATDKEFLFDELIRIGISRPVARKCINSTRAIPEEMVSSYIRIMTICAQYLTLSNAMPGAKPTITEAAQRFIAENVAHKITIKDVCLAAGCSKTTLISTYKREFGLTVNEAINDAKVNEAKKLLENDCYSIGYISERTGFNDQSYFTKVFTTRCGMSPTEYKRMVHAEKREAVPSPEIE